MKLREKIIYSLFFSFLICTVCFFIAIIPCQEKANIPNSEFFWTFCTFDQTDMAAGEGTLLYFGATQSVRGAYALVLLISFLACFILLAILFKKKRKR